MRFWKLITHILLTVLLTLGANGVVSAKVASGDQNLIWTAHQADGVVNWLTHQGKSARSMTGPPGSPVATKNGTNFDQARREAFENAGMTDPSKVKFSKIDEATGTVVEFKGPGGAKIGYDGPHKSPGPHHDTQHISWQSAGKRGRGGAKRGNIPYNGPRHPSRPDRKDQ